MCDVSRREANLHGCLPAVCNTRVGGWFREPAAPALCPLLFLQRTQHGFVSLSALPSMGADNPTRIRGPAPDLETLVFLFVSCLFTVCHETALYRKGLLARLSEALTRDRFDRVSCLTSQVVPLTNASPRRPCPFPPAAEAGRGTPRGLVQVFEYDCGQRRSASWCV